MSMILLIALVALGGWLATGLLRGARHARARDATGDFSRALAAMSPPSPRRRDPGRPGRPGVRRAAVSPRRTAGR